MKSLRALHVLTLLAITAVAMAGSAAAQTFTGGVRGVVSDANGVIPGATVTLVNDATNVSRETSSNEVGQYNFPAVPPGTYSIRAQLTGYKTFERTGVRVATQQFLTLDIRLELGTIQETITVVAEAPLIDSTTASTGGVLDRELLESLPAPGRNAFLVGVTVPTVMPVGDPQFNRQQDQTNASRISLGGGGIRANNYLLDGVPITELTGRAILNPSIEAVEEVKVQVHTYDAEMGQTGGGVFNVATRSGSNDFHGSAFFQTRPVWGQNQNFFDDVAGRTKEQTGLSQAYYRLYGGAVGGPVFRDRTFFWFASEGYRSFTTRALNYVWPSLRQRTGDFSGTSIGGIPVRLFNPWCRGGVASARCPATGTGSLATNGEFINAIIPRSHPAANTTGFNLVNAWPTRTAGGAEISPNEDGEANARDTARIVDAADMFTVKVDHRFTNRISLSGFYVYNRTNEPGSGIMPPEFQHIENTAEYFTTLRRRPHALVINNTNIINDTTVLALRYGWTTWQDQTDFAEYTPGLASLGFSPAYVSGLHPDGPRMFPALSFNENTANVGGWGGNRRRWKGPIAINAALTKLWGNHNLKMGADYRQFGIQTTTETQMSGGFRFDRRFTSAAGIAGSGHELASLLLGLPVEQAGGTGSQVPVNRGEFEWFLRGYGGFIQDDWRVNSRLSMNFGVRVDHGDGLREVENRQTVGFDRNLANPIDALVPKTGTLLQGQTLRGGLLYAGVDGANDYQGDPPAVTVAPRAGLSYSLNSRTVVRGGYGLFFAPARTSAATHGQGPFARTTTLSQTASPNTEMPITTLDNPYPGGILQPIGSSLGALGLVGGSLEVIDQHKGAAKVHQYSVDVQRELAGNMAVTIGYTGATGRDIGFGGSNTVAININQIDPEVARRLFPGANGTWNAAALNASVPNPFFGIAAAGELGRRATVPAGQLIRPFPQFGDINVFEVTEGGKRQYHAMVLELDKRVATRGWGGRLSYTWSNTRDNQFGETNTYASTTAVPQDFYDLDAEYGVSNFDSPHRIILAPIYRIPGPTTGRAALLLGGWTTSAIVELVSGAPLNATLSAGTSNTALGLLGGRQRPNVVADPNISGSDEEKVDTAITPGARWFNRGAFANPGGGQYGNAPRTLDDARLQFRKNLDIVVAKDTRFAGGQTAQIRFELLNLTNTPKFGGAVNTTDTATFGRITTQRGFMRIWQISLRYGF
jgi:hypothetical protein